MSSFSEFNNQFYTRVTDFTLFDCEEVNLLKVVLDGLRVNYEGPHRIGKDFRLNPSVYALKNYARRLKNKLVYRPAALLNPHALKEKTYLVGFSQRNVQTELGEIKSTYFEYIFNELGKEKCVFIGEEKHSALEADFYLYDIINEYCTHRITAEEKKFKKSLNATFLKITQSGIFSDKEIQGIQSAFEVFFKHYLAWNKLLRLINPKVAIFDQHYHREAFILCCKRKKIKTVELQHGLIAENDVFYVFPESIKGVSGRALFADEILVYGQYWRNKLLKGIEYPAGSIKVLGYYHYELPVKCSDQNLLQFIEGSNVVLVTTQTNMHTIYLEYIRHLSELISANGYNWRILVKPHPNELPATYASLESLNNCLVVNQPLNVVFSVSTMHISVYSTTLYDAHRYKLKSYTVPLEPFADYSREISGDGIAEEILAHEDPIKIYLNAGVKPAQDQDLKNKLYAALDLSTLRQSIANT